MSNGTDLSINRISPVVDFTSLDFDAIDADLTSYAQEQFADRWTDFNEDQFAVVFKQMIAYLGDLLGYHINASVRETFNATAVRLQNVVNNGKAFNIDPPQASAATVAMELTLDPGGVYPFTITKAGNQFSNGSPTDEVTFQPLVDTVVSAYPVGGTISVDCQEGEYFENVLIGVSNGTAGQRWQFPQTGILFNTVVLTVGVPIWTRISNFINSSSSDQHYKLLQNDDGTTFAVFGDGIFGVIPATGLQIRATFRTGGGIRGNLNPDTIKTLVFNHANILSVTNPLKSSNGAPAASLKEAKRAIPNTLSTLERAVNEEDYSKLATLVSGVAKAFARSGGTRRIEMVVAPNGGGDPTDVLKNTVLTSVKPKKMVGNRLRAIGPVYRDIRYTVLIHVNSSFREDEVNQKVRSTIVHPDGSGLLDFGQLDFRGIDVNGELLLAQTRLQDHFATLKTTGVDRAEILKLDVAPLPRAKATGNTGNGSIGTVTLSGQQRHREYRIVLISASQYQVYERIVGQVGSITDTVLTDDTKTFGDEGVSNFAGYKLLPDRDAIEQLTVVSASGRNIVTDGSLSLYSLTDVGTWYALFAPTPTTVNVGSQYTNADGSVKFTLSAGVTPFATDDEFTLDIFPVISDIKLREDEYPRLTDANFITRTSGGARI